MARALHRLARFHWNHVPWLPGKWRLQQLALACLDHDLLEPVARVDGGLSFAIDPSDYVQRHVFATGSWEEETTRLVLAGLGSDGSFLDVGAHVGYFTLVAGRALASGGRVHAFEPVPHSFELLNRNVADNGLDNVVLNNAACWSTPGELTVHEASASNTGKSSVVRDNADSADAPAVAHHTVRAVTIDDYVSGLVDEAVAMIKVDVEGCEPDVLEGAWGTIEAHRPILVLEVMPELLRARRSSATKLLAALAERGYRCHLTDWNGPHAIERGFGNAVFTARDKRFPDPFVETLALSPELEARS